MKRLTTDLKMQLFVKFVKPILSFVALLQVDKMNTLYYSFVLFTQVRMVKVLVDIYRVNPKEIVVLSQYRLQCDKITKKLKDCEKSDVDVRTVVKSQGENG